MPWARIWSTFCVMVAEFDLPSNKNTSAPYVSMAYFCASVNCAWWNTLLRSDTKKAIFFGGHRLPGGCCRSFRNRDAGAELAH